MNFLYCLSFPSPSFGSADPAFPCFPSRRLLLCLLLLQSGLLVSAVGLWGQNEIVRSDSAQLLRKVWMQRGSVAGGDRVGEGAGSVGDINGDSIMDLAWYHGRLHQWFIYLGGLEFPHGGPYQVLDSLGTNPSHPVFGDFYGDGTCHVGFSGFYEIDRTGPRTKWFMRYRLLPVMADTLSLPLSLIMAVEQTWRPAVEATPVEVFAEDLDRDGDDELVVVVGGTQVDQVGDARAEVWIFAGGPEFSLDSPTVVLKDDQENDGTLYAAVGDLDGDSYPEIIVSGQYKGTERPIYMKFWWGKSHLHDLSAQPDRSVILPQSGANIDATFTLVDCDGDKRQDILRLHYGSPQGTYLYRSGAGKNIRERSLTLRDADGYWPGYTIFGRGGYVNDSLQRYETTIMLGSRMLFFSGGAEGPNYTYDGYYSAADDGMIAGSVFGVGGPVGDATGDGWDDYLTGNPQWYGQDQGIVLLLSGGPYIPNDDPTVSVREEPVAGEAGGLSLWPNPVVEELHIAWKGNLRKMPDRLVVYDAAGRLVVERGVEGWRGSAIWRCGSVASGTYLLVVFDETGEVIATARVVKE